MVAAEPVEGLGAVRRGVQQPICLRGKGLAVCWWV